MIISHIIGGLGNQMFQYAMGRSLALRDHQDYKIDTHDFATYPLHHYGLNDLSITAPLATAEEIQQVRRKQHSLLLARCIIRKKPSHKGDILEKAFTYDPSLQHFHSDAYLKGYWQTEKYFNNTAPTIRSEFTVRHAPDTINEHMLNEINACESVAVHVRRGDYVQNKKTLAFHGVLPVDYYQRAVREMQKFLHTPTYFIFSDDPNWVKANLHFEAPKVYVNHNGSTKDYEDLRLMATCKHHIIANSTFSWWGAWLAEHPAQKVITPLHWFANNQDTTDLIPNRWLRL